MSLNIRKSERGDNSLLVGKRCYYKVPTICSQAKSMSKDNSLTSHTLLDGARMYAASADAINEKLPNSLHVISQCLGTSIELALKAFLRSHGYSEKQLRKLGHDLPTLLEQACERGLLDTGSRKFVLTVTGRNYKDRLFSYPENAIMNIIEPLRLRQIADELIREVYVYMYGLKKFEQSKQEQGLYISSEYVEEACTISWKCTNK